MSVILTCWLFYVGIASADVYQSYDSEGRAVFSDKASSQSVQLDQYTRYPRQQQTISSVYDGDTVRFKNGQRVRLLGISAPEIKSRYRSGEVGGPAAKRWLKDNKGIMNIAEQAKGWTPNTQKHIANLENNFKPSQIN